MKKIMFAVFAISAIVLLNSCGNESAHRATGPKDFPNGPSTQISDHSTGYSIGDREQTETGEITYTGIVDGQFLEADMVPVRLCNGEIVWAKFADNLYKVAVEVNQLVGKGKRIEVSMKEVGWWLFWRRFEINSIVILESPVLPVKDSVMIPTPAPVVKKPVHRFRKMNPQPQTVVIQQQPCCCGTNITINGTNNAPIITGNGNNAGGVTPAPIIRQEPVWMPVIPQRDGPKEKLKLDSTQVSKKSSKKEPWILPWN